MTVLNLIHQNHVNAVSSLAISITKDIEMAIESYYKYWLPKFIRNFNQAVLNKIRKTKTRLKKIKIITKLRNKTVKKKSSWQYLKGMY